MSAVIAFRPGWIVNQQAIEEKGEQYALDPIGTGPYMWEGRSIGTEVVLVRNPDYYAPVDIETVRFKFVQEDSVAELALQSGDLDIAYLFAPESSQRALENSGGDIQAEQIASYRTQWAGFNLSREQMQDVRVRQAIIHAIDKQAAATAVAGDLAQVVSSIFNPNLSATIDPDPFPYDPDRARELLAEAGYPDGIDIQVLVIPSSTWPDLATVVQEQWRQVGINAELLVVERAVYDELMGQENAPYDIATVNITRSEPYQYASYFVSTNIPDPNFHNYANEESDDLIAAASRELDPEVRDDLWAQWQEKVLVEDVVGFGMTNINYVIAWRSSFSFTGAADLYVDSYPIWDATLD
jgi:peptide/nickel transport system substrate-binding protein